MPSFVPGSMISTDSILWSLKKPYITDHIKNIISTLDTNCSNSKRSAFIEKINDDYYKIFIPIVFIQDVANFISIVCSSYLALTSLQFIKLHICGGNCTSPTHIVFYFHLKKEIDPSPKDAINLIINMIGLSLNNYTLPYYIKHNIFIKEKLL